MATFAIRRRRPAPSPPPAVRQGLRASAQRFNLKNKKVTAKQAQPVRPWQTEAWEYSREVPEIKYSNSFMGNVMAKCRLFVAVRDADDPEAPPIPATDPEAGLPPGAALRAQMELDRLKGPLGGRAEILRAGNMNLEIAGEGYIIGWGPREQPIVDPDTEQPTGEVEIIPEQWGVYSVSQVTPKAGRFEVKLRPSDKELRTLDPNLDAIIRVFQRDPEWSLEADCNMRGVLSECEALVLLTNSIKADAKSRMSAGYLLIPHELSTGPDRETDPEDGEEAPVDPFLQELYDGAVDPVEDPSSAAAVAPTFIRGPADALKEFRHVTITRTADQYVLAKITAGIERIARGLNLPVEVVMGHQQTTFANALQVSKDTFNDHFQPRCMLIADALTVGFLVPNLIEAGMDPDVAERLVVWFDPSDMIAQPNPIDTADKGYEMGLLSGEAWRRAGNWSEDDAPDPVEQLVQAVLKLGQFDPSITSAILDLLGVPLDIQPAAAPAPAFAQAAGVRQLLAAAITNRYDVNGNGARRTLDQLMVDVLARDPSIEHVSPPPLELTASRTARRNRGHELTMLDRDLRVRLLTAADAALTRALEKAGNKLRSKAGQTRTLAKAGFIHSVYVASHLGRKLVADAGFSDDDLIGVDAWSGLESSFRAWVAAAQQKALAIVGDVVDLSAAHRSTLALRQAADLDRAWLWMRDELHKLAVGRLFAPDPTAPAAGEFDPSVRIPVGLVRQALAIAGGATGLAHVEPRRPALRAVGGGSMGNPGAEAEGQPVFVAVNNDQPLGGVGLGELVGETLVEGGAGVEGFVWVYGPAFRAHPFDPHEELDGVPFVNFDDDVLASGNASEDASWIGPFLYPGDHDGCNCDFEPTLLDPDELAAIGDEFLSGPTGAEAEVEPEAEDVEPAATGDDEHLPIPTYIEELFNVSNPLGVERLDRIVTALADQGGGMTLGDFDAVLNAGLSAGQRFELADIATSTFDPLSRAGAAPSLAMRGNFIAADGTRLAHVERVFNFETKTMHAELFSVSKAAQGMGLAKQHLGALADLAEKFGITKFEVHANIDVGGYAWLKYGYLPPATKSGVRTLVTRSIDRLESAAGNGVITAADRDRGVAMLRAVFDARERGDNVGDVRGLWDLADDPVLGKPAFLGADWDGTLDLTDRASMGRFRKYLGR